MWNLDISKKLEVLFWLCFQSEVFQVPVDPAMEPEYHNIIVHPMDMSTLDKNIKKKVYGSTEAFLADAKWILHNSIQYNGS